MIQESQKRSWIKTISKEKAFFVACSSGYSEIARILKVDVRIDTAEEDKFGQTTFFACCKFGWAAIAETLLEEKTLSKADNDKTTPCCLRKCHNFKPAWSCYEHKREVMEGYLLFIYLFLLIVDSNNYYFSKKKKKKRKNSWSLDKHYFKWKEKINK